MFRRNEHDLRLIQAFGDQRTTVAARARMSEAGQLAAPAGLVVSGWAFRGVTLAGGRRQIVSILLPGDYFGLEHLFGARAAQSIDAVTRLTYLRLSTQNLSGAVMLDPRLCVAVLRQLLRERRMLQEHLAVLGQSSAPERVAWFLAHIHERLYPRSFHCTSRFSLPLTQKQMADHLGLNLMHINRTLKHLRGSGVVHVERGIVHVRDLTELRRLGGLGGTLRPQAWDVSPGAVTMGVGRRRGRALVHQQKSINVPPLLKPE